MITTLTIIHSIVSVLLIATVLLHFGKGAEAGLVLDTNSSSILPQQGNMMTRVASVLATLFLVLSLALAVIRSHTSQKSLFDEKMPATTTTTATPATAAPVTAPSAPEAAPAATTTTNATAPVAAPAK
jgi:preprotein translocase subunit SecG